MKILKTISLSLFTLVLMQAKAQTAPDGYAKGTIIMADGSSQAGFIKDNMRKSASIAFITAENEKKKNYDGSVLSVVEIGETKYLCISGDFFKVVCNGEPSLLQKASDASGKIIFNGAESVATAGTAGKPGSYFTYHNSDRSLTIIDSKNEDNEIAKNFPGCKAAVATTSAAE